jgi:hypothetical protein
MLRMRFYLTRPQVSSGVRPPQRECDASRDVRVGLCMGRLAVLLLSVLACRASQPILAAQAPSATPLRVLGEANPDSMPPSCRVHGGTPPVAWAPPSWTWSKQRDHGLDSLGAGRLVIHLVSARTGVALQTGALYLEATPPSRPIRGYVSEGWTHLQAPAGRYALRIRSIGLGQAILDSLDVRRGYADTLRLGVGQPWFCRL